MARIKRNFTDQKESVDALLWADMKETLILAPLAFILAIRSAACSYASRHERCGIVL